MAYVKKGYIGDSSVAAKLNNGNTKIQNGTVYKAYGGVGTGGRTNLTTAGYPGSVGSYNPRATSFSSAVKALGGTTNSNTGGYTTSGSRSGSGGSSSSSASAYDDGSTSAYSALLAAYAQQQRDYEEYLRQQREAAQNAYNRGMSALNSAYDTQLGSLKDNLSETKNQLLNQYNRSKSGITTDAEDSLRQAYINNMLSQKNLGQQMSAQGLTGGASESTMASMANNYGNARNAINTVANTNLSNLEGNYSDNLSSAMQAYNSAVADANLKKSQQVMALEDALANNEISALGNYQSLLQQNNQNYLDLLKAAIANGASFAYSPTEANNATKAVAVQQAANPGITNNYATIQELMGNGTTIPGVNSAGMTVLNTNNQNNLLAQLLAQLQAARG